MSYCMLVITFHTTSFVYNWQQTETEFVFVVLLLVMYDNPLMKQLENYSSRFNVDSMVF